MEIVKKNAEEIIIYAIMNVKICAKMIVLPVKLNAKLIIAKKNVK
jgi:hypothetical protein